jgi:hypothetical protein
MDKGQEEDATPAEVWLNQLNNVCNRLSAQYLNLLRTASSVSAKQSGSSSGGTSATETRGKKEKKKEMRLVFLFWCCDLFFVFSFSSSSSSFSLFVCIYYSYFPFLLSFSFSVITVVLSGSFLMQNATEPSPALAAEVRLSALQCRTAAENLCEAVTTLVTLIRTLRLSLLLMDHDTMEAEENIQMYHSQQRTQTILQQAVHIEQELIQLRRQYLEQEEEY